MLCKRTQRGVTFVVGWLVCALAPSFAVCAEPSACVYDAPSPLAGALTDAQVRARSEWVRITEDDTSHRFQGTPVVVNDKLVVVFSREKPEAAIYSLQTGRLTPCAHLRAFCGDEPGGSVNNVAIEENSSANVILETQFLAADGMPGSVKCELGAGAAFVKTTRGGAVSKLQVIAPCRYAVLPDFFGDDMVVDAEELPVARAQIPAENFLLHMIPGGDAIVMTVSQSREDDVRVTLSPDQPRWIQSSDIAYGNQAHIWVGVLADRGIWHERNIALEEADKVIDLAWRAPFTALWRVDWATSDEMTDSWEMLLQHPEGKYVMQGWFGQDESEGQRFGEEFGDRDWNKPGRRRWNPVLGSFAFPCWIDMDGQAHLQPLKERRYVERGDVHNFAGPAVIYPLGRVDKAPFQTPLDKLTAVDMVRMTLGVGPCEYLLDMEGQKRNSRGVATCYARDVINAIYKEKSQLQRRDAIQEHLGLAVTFIRNVRERIDQYIAFGHEMAIYLDEQKHRNPKWAPFCDEMLAITRRLDQFYEEKRAAIRNPVEAQRAADRFRKELLSYTGEDAFEKCEKEMRTFTSIGGAQDGLVASCRMVVKMLRQRAGIMMAEDPELTEVATEVRSRTQKILRNPTAYEAPRH